MRRRHRTKPDPTDDADVTPAPFVRALLPIVAAQAVALWAALRGSLAYLDYQLLVGAELLLVQMSFVVIAAPGQRRERLRTFATTAFFAVPGLLFFNALLVPIATLPDAAVGTPFALIAEAIERLFGDGLRYAFAYLVAGFGIAALQARSAAEPLRAWYVRVAAESSTNTGAMLLGMFALAPVIIARQQIDAIGAIGTATMDAALVVMMVVLRLALSVAWEIRVARGRAGPTRDPAGGVSRGKQARVRHPRKKDEPRERGSSRCDHGVTGDPP